MQHLPKQPRRCFKQIKYKLEDNMKNKSVSEFVAATMDAVLKSESHRTLFEGQYKTASADKMCAKHGKMDDCDSHSVSDSNSADDNDAKKKKEESSSSSSDSHSADDNDAKKKKEESSSSDSHSASDGSSDEADSSYADDMESSAFDVAIDSLLTASAALDNVGMEKSAALSLKLASIVVEAKKKEKDSKKSKKDSKKSDSNDARSKKKDDSKKDSKSSSSKGSSKKK